MSYKQKTTYIIVLISAVFFLTACANLKEIDSKIGKFFDGEQSEKKEIVSELKGNGFSFSELNREQKEKIDLWLKTNGYNRYGDKQDTYYNGGTPLFDESSGETKERYEYILENHPDILIKI